MSDQDRRRALNEATFRRVNEEIAELGSAWEMRELRIVCECGNIDCAEPLTVSIRGYETARSDPRTFLVCLGHNDPEIERIVDTRGDHHLVQKIGDAAEPAIATDPR